MAEVFKTNKGECLVKDFLYCYSVKLRDFLIERGHRYICVGINERANTRFWLFEKTNELKASLDEYDALNK